MSDDEVVLQLNEDEASVVYWALGHFKEYLSSEEGAKSEFRAPDTEDYESDFNQKLFEPSYLDSIMSRIDSI